MFIRTPSQGGQVAIVSPTYFRDVRLLHAYFKDVKLIYTPKVFNFTARLFMMVSFIAAVQELFKFTTAILQMFKLTTATVHTAIQFYRSNNYSRLSLPQQHYWHSSLSQQPYCHTSLPQQHYCNLSLPQQHYSYSILPQQQQQAFKYTTVTQYSHSSLRCKSSWICRLTN